MNNNRLKSTIILLCFFSCSLLIAQENNLLKKTVSIDLKNYSQEKALEYLTKTYGIKFVYSNTFLKKEKRITINEERFTINDIIDKILQGTNLKINSVEGNLIVIAPDKTVKPIRKEIKGKVVDAQSNEILQYASVQIENSQIGAYCDDLGEFTLPLPEAESALLVSFVGYKTERIVVPKTNSEPYLLISLNPINYYLQEVMVYGRSDDEISTVSVRNEQIEDFAGLTKDALRSIQLLPGVSSNNEASAQVNVRGGSYDENIVIINDVEVYKPFHLKALSMASIGIFNIDLVKNIDFSAGGFSAEYGNATSSVMKVNMSTGDKTKYSGKVDLSLVDLSALYQGPLSSSGSFIIGVRKSYFDYLMKILNVSTDIHMSYYDINGSLHYEFDGKNKIDAVFIFSKDYANEDPNTDISRGQIQSRIYNTYARGQRLSTAFREVKTNYGNILASVKYDKTFSNKVRTQTILSLYSELEDINAISTEKTDYSYNQFPDFWIKSSFERSQKDKLIIQTASIKQNIDLALSNYYFIKAGVEYRNIYYNYDRKASLIKSYSDNLRYYPNIYTFDYPLDPEYNDTSYINTHTYRISGFAENLVQLSDEFIINLGLRGDYYDINKQTKYSPRVSMSYKLPWNITARFAWGIYYQPPTLKQLRSMESTSNNTSCQRADHYILGLENNISESVSIKIEGYYKKYSQLIPIINLSNGDFSYGKKENNALGYAAGFDLQAIVKSGQFDIWLSYGFLVSKEKIINTSSYYSRYSDQTHTLSAAINCNLGNGWDLGIRFFYGSGYAYTPSYLSVSQNYSWIPGEKNSEHYPAYKRIDLRINKSFNIASYNVLKVYLDVMNLFNRENTLSYTYGYDGFSNPEIKSTKLFGLLPTLGMSFSF